MSIHIAGTVVDSGSGQALPNLLVSVFDADAIRDDVIGVARTDAWGAFAVVCDEGRYRDLLVFDEAPDVYFRVHDAEGSLIYNSAASSLEDVRGQRLTVTLRVDRDVAAARPVVVASRSGDPRDVAAELGGEVTPAEFGQHFVARVLTEDTLAKQTVALFPQRVFTERREEDLGPVQVRVASRAELEHPAVWRVGLGLFDVVVPVRLQVGVTGSLGPFDGAEEFVGLARVGFRLRARLFDTLKIYVEASRVTREQVALSISARSWSSLSRSQVESGVRDALSARFEEAIRQSLPARIIDLHAEVQRFLRERFAAPSHRPGSPSPPESSSVPRVQ